MKSVANKEMKFVAEDILLQEELVQIMPMVNEANAMSEELDQKMVYEIALISAQSRGLKEGRTEVGIFQTLCCLFQQVT